MEIGALVAVVMKAIENGDGVGARWADIWI